MAALHQLLDKGAGHARWHVRIMIYQRACIQYRLGAVQWGHVSAFEEFPNGYFLTPDQRPFHRGYPVSRVISAIVFQFLHSRPEPLIGVVVVIGDARAEHIQKRKTLVQNALLDQFRQVLLLAAKATGNE